MNASWNGDFWILSSVPGVYPRFTNVTASPSKSASFVLNLGVASTFCPSVARKYALFFPVGDDHARFEVFEEFDRVLGSFEYENVHVAEKVGDLLGDFELVGGDVRDVAAVEPKREKKVRGMFGHVHEDVGFFVFPGEVDLHAVDRYRAFGED
jgi:hypothetical protein